ncbi:MAG: hypothetical protein AB1894_04040 [Chloroflexota bacterium]
MKTSTRLKLGHLIFDFTLEQAEDQWGFERAYGAFLTQAEPQVHLAVHHTALPDLSNWELVFDSGGLWSLWRNGAQRALRMRSPMARPPIYQVAILDESFTRGEIYAAPLASGQYNFPFEHILAEVLAVQLLARGRGALLHACALQDGPHGRIFVGNSGAGKSTIAGMWASLPDVHMFTDDRVIIQKQGGEYVIHGTPWHGTAQYASPGSAPLQQIHILQQTPQNQARRLPPAQAAAQLMVRAFTTPWDSQGTAFTLDFLAELAGQVPCFELGFTPQPEVVEFVRCL